MSSYGETDIQCNSQIIGRVRLLHIYDPSAVYPRLGLQLGCTLNESGASATSSDQKTGNLQLRDLHGELRLQQQAQTVGPISWIEHRRHVRSTNYAHENQLRAVCDLDWSRLDVIERERDGAEPTFWLVLWPNLFDGTAPIDADINPFRVVIPRDRWLEYLAGVRKTTHTIVEISHALELPASLKGCGSHIDAGYRKLDEGHYQDAVAAARRAIEALIKALELPNEVSAIAEWLEGRTDRERATSYAGVIGQLKQLGNRAVHHTESKAPFARSEAVFVLNTTVHVAVLVGALMERGGANSV